MVRLSTFPVSRHGKHALPDDPLSSDDLLWHLIGSLNCDNDMLGVMGILRIGLGLANILRRDRSLFDP